MTDTEAIKRAIRKRMFRAQAREGQKDALHGWRWCAPCRGQGDICREYSSGDRHWAAFEICPHCAGEGMVEAE